MKVKLMTVLLKSGSRGFQLKMNHSKRHLIKGKLVSIDNDGIMNYVLSNLLQGYSMSALCSMQMMKLQWMVLRMVMDAVNTWCRCG